jgi:hypothetical protein
MEKRFFGCSLSWNKVPWRKCFAKVKERMKTNFALVFSALSIYLASNSLAQLGVTKPADSFPGTPLPAGSSATITNADGRTSITTNQFSTNQIAIDPALQNMLINLQANAQQLLPALVAFNNTAQLQGISNVTPPAQTPVTTPSASGANLSGRASVNLSTRAGVNSSLNVSQPAAGTTPTTPPFTVATIPPAVGAPPSPTGAQNPFAGYAGSGNVQRDLVLLQADLERLLPTLTAINNQTRLGGADTNHVRTGTERNPLAERFGLPLTNQSSVTFSNAGVVPLTNTFVTPLTNNSLQVQPLRSPSPF